MFGTYAFFGKKSNSRLTNGEKNSQALHDLFGRTLEGATTLRYVNARGFASYLWLVLYQ